MAEQKDKTTPPSLTARFQRFLAPIEGTDCLRWTGTKHHRTGHGIFQVAAGVNWAASRVAWVIAHAEPLVASQAIEPRCTTGKLCVAGAHWQLAKKPRRRPVHIKRYSRQVRDDYVKFALHLGVEQVAQLFDIERRTLTRWLSEHRKTLNGGSHPGAATAQPVAPVEAEGEAAR